MSRRVEITRRAFVIGTAGIVLVGCGDDKPPAPPQPQPSSTQWRFLNSPGLPPSAAVEANGLPYFDFPSPAAGSVHMLMRATGALSAFVRVRYRVEGGPFIPVQGSTPAVSLMFQRADDNWSGAGPYESYRWYSSGSPLTAGEHTLEAPLTEEHWRNVYGRQDPQGFAGAKANAAMVGMAFGDPGAGATAHGVSGDGRFTVTEFSVS